MHEKEYLSMNIGVRARMTIADEIQRQKRLGLEIIDEQVIQGLIEQRRYFENQLRHSFKSLVILVFLSFVAWQGGNIKIPGTGASIIEVPAFLEITLVLSALTMMWLPYVFLCIQLYDAVIQTTVKKISTDSQIDEDIVVASRMPVQLFIKYAREDVTIGRKNGYKISKKGKVYNIFIILLPVLVYSLVLIFLMVSILMIAHLGLGDDLIGWLVYLTCWFAVLVGVYAISANFISPDYEMDFENLEN